MNCSEYEKMKMIVNNTFPVTLKEDTVDFLTYLNNNSIEFERLSGYWKNQFYWMAKYNNGCVCYILLNGKDDEKQFSPLTIWTDDSLSATYEKAYISEDLKKSAWKNIDYCVHCGSCSGGRYRIIFGKGFDNVCRCQMRFTNPDEQEFETIKELIKIRKSMIESVNNNEKTDNENP